MKTIKKNIHGVVLLDKPTGMSSNRALQKVKHAFPAKKAGHTGSLDPLATGLLPICLGQATKVSEYLLHSEKKYTTTIKLGETTDTYDSEGQVLLRRNVDVSDAQIERALERFRGAIKQVPPMYSALKKNGQPLYKLARQGKEIERPARDMFVHSLSADRLSHSELSLHVHCSSGFYIRSLAYDLGEALGCGAHVIELRRTSIKSIGLEQAIPLDDFLASDNPLQFVQPIECLVGHIPKLGITEQQVATLSQGQRPPADNYQKHDLVRLYAPDDTLFAVGAVDESGCLSTKKIFVLDS